MKFSEFYLREDGEVTTGDIGGVRAPLMGMGSRKLKKPKIKKVFEGKEEFSSKDVESKLAGAERSGDLKRDAVVYGLEDDDGNITKVFIAKDQDAEFKQTLADIMQDESKDVAEILFDLRNSFDILFVEWPKLPEDEEVENKLVTDENPEEKPDETSETPEQPGGEPTTEMPAEPAVDSQSVLLKVIDMLRADADAKAAEANAKAKEAEAETARQTLQLTNIKVKNEEDMLKADDYFKKQQEDKKEEDRIAKLAKYRNEVVKDTTYESTFVDVLKNVTEDTGSDIANIQVQIANLNSRKQQAMQVFDNQIKSLQMRLDQKQKQASAESARKP